jgi:hypothetical protein
MRPVWMLLLPIAGCSAAPPLATLAAPSPIFDPLAFFSGHTEGEGRLKIFASRARSVHVHGDGRVDGDGTLHLVQSVVEGDHPPTSRAWAIRAAGERRYDGTLTDADGPIAGDVRDNRLHLQFRMKHGLRVEQWLYLQPGAQIARNRMTVRKFGVVVATLDETIRRVP